MRSQSALTLIAQPTLTRGLLELERELGAPLFERRSKGMLATPLGEAFVADGSEPPPDHFMLYVPSAHPGGLAPHLWLSDGSSLYDHFGEGFTVLVTEGDPKVTDVVISVASKRKVPVKVVAPGDIRLRERYGARFALIRPDQHVAWRGDNFPADSDGLIACVTGSSGRRAQLPTLALQELR